MVVKVKVVLVVVKVASIKTSKVVVGEVGVKRVAAELLKPYSEQKNSNSSKSCSKGSSKKNCNRSRHRNRNRRKSSSNNGTRSFTNGNTTVAYEEERSFAV